MRPEGLVLPVRLDPKGLSGPTRSAARSGPWRRTSRGWYVPADTVRDVVEQRILEQVVRLPEVGAVSAWASLRWRGGSYFTGEDRRTGNELPVPVVLGGWSDLGRDSAMVVSRERLVPSELDVVDGVPCARSERALFDEIRRGRSLRPAVVTLEMAVAAQLVTLDSFAAYVATRNGWTGVPFVRTVLPLARSGARSPQEVGMRLVWVLDAGLPEPLCNVPVFDLRGRLLGFPDLLDPEAGVVGEYDGSDHTELDRRQSDGAREDRFRDHGLEYFELVRGDLRDVPRVVRRMRRTRDRARFLPPERRQWTLDPPAGWRDPRV